MRRDRKVSQGRLPGTPVVSDDNTEFQLLLHPW